MNSAPDTGIEIVVEPDVRPKGTVDLRALDAPPGSIPPAVRITADGRVVGREEPSGPAPALAPPRRPAAALEPAPASLAPASLAPASLAPAAEPASARLNGRHPPEPEGTISAEALIAAAEASATDTRTLAALDAAANAPIPPRPAAAALASPSAVPSSPRPLGADADDDPDSLGQGFSAIWTLLKVLLYLITLTALLGALGWWLIGSSLQDPILTAIAPPTQGSTTQAPPTESPPAETPPAETPPAETPPAETPPAETPPVETPPVETPPGEGTGGPGPAPLATPPGSEPGAELVTLDALKIIAEDAATGGEVGVEEDQPGLLAKIEALRAQAVEALKRGELDQARAALLALLEANPRDADATFRLGLVEERSGQPAEAERRYQAATGLDGGRDPRPWNNLGLLLLARGAGDDAEQAWTRGLEGSPRDPNLNVNVGRLREPKDAAAALACYDRALEVDPNHGPARLARARLRRARGDGEGARADLTALAQSGSPLAPAALNGLGVLSREAGRLEAALELHRRALELDPAYTPSRVNLGLGLLELGKDEQAAAELAKAVKQSPTSAAAWAALGVARTRLADSAPDQLYQAKEAYEAALKLEPKDPGTLFNYALCAERFGNFLFAMRKYEEVLQLDPANWRACANLARLYQRGNDSKKARALLEQGLAAAPGAAELHYQLGWLLANAQEQADARRSLQRFSELARPDDPRLEDVKRGLAAR